VQGVWGISVAAQIIVCALLIFRGHFRKIPVFSSYAAANILQAGLLYMIYSQFGFGSRTALVLAWSSQTCLLLLRILATMEVLHLVLGPYRGIWGLGWRVLAGTFGVLLLYASIEARRNISWAVVLADRGSHLAFAAALVACLLLIRYYSIPVEFTYKVLLGGFCAYSCAAVLTNAMAYTLSLRGFANDEPVWQLTTITAYVVVQIAWAVALWKVAPAGENKPALIKTSLYQQLSPQINERLYALNEQLNQLWRPRVTRN
jgi:hypothetical protein